ncbi:Serine/threonine-protein kinase pkn5 [Tetrabaena socialis]|uniref:Serine/threonine-protein kinase pkn5 n=1 Tax=Tetrabaena socialis TaxID=47790 RepID=A0A2J7ZKP3_9CHLO|nr:Serine/threonine-protein kinase pkn5 [Tetrabaena socialis]|eukprot:PNH00820.1 Serine/threonine-protein kinase pkn5 [Tetrabaena socialis]
MEEIEIGAGSSGQVHTVPEEPGVATKRIRIISRKGIIDASNVTETAVASYLKRHNLPGFIHVLEVGEHGEHGASQRARFIAGIKMSHAVGGNLDEFIQKTSFQDRMTVLPRIYTQLLEAFGALHGHGIFHGDIKTANIVVTDATLEHFTVKVIDFGSCRFYRHAAPIVQRDDNPLIGCTFAFAAPEAFGVWGGQELNYRMDAYSLGVVLHDCIFKCSVYDESSNRHAHQLRDLHKNGKIADPIRQSAPRGVPGWIYDDMVKLMRPNPCDRATIESRLARSANRSAKRSKEFILDAPDVLHWGTGRATAVQSIFDSAQGRREMRAFALAVNIADRFVHARKRPCAPEELDVILILAGCLVGKIGRSRPCPDAVTCNDVLRAVNFELYSETCDIILRYRHKVHKMDYSLLKTVLIQSNGVTLDACDKYIYQA